MKTALSVLLVSMGMMEVSGALAADSSCDRITMVNAYYGTSSKQCDATMAVKRLLRQNGDGRSVEFKVSNKLCGDPAHGKAKTLTVEYACGKPGYCDDKPRIATADEFHTLSMSCKGLSK